MTSSNPHGRTLSPRYRMALSVGFAVLVLMSMVSVLVLTLTATSSESGSPVERVGQVFSGENEVQEAREEVMAQTRQFMLRMGTFGPDQLDESRQMPEYRDQVKAVITPKFAADFEKEVATAEQLVAQAGVARVAEVFATGVSVIDQDSATALVAGSFTDSFPQGQKGQRQSAEPVPFRIEVSLVKTEGEWLVDDFTPITGVE